jgi:hypothetical protein
MTLLELQRAIEESREFHAKTHKERSYCPDKLQRPMTI